MTITRTSSSLTTTERGIATKLLQFGWSPVKVVRMLRDRRHVLAPPYQEFR